VSGRSAKLRPVVTIDLDPAGMRHTALVSGFGLSRDVVPLLRTIDCPHQWNATRSIMVPRTRAADVEALLLTSGYAVRVIEALPASDR
jgi:hypothetical protein